MLALVDGVPRTLSLDAFIRHWVTHQIDVIVRRTRLPPARGRGTPAHPRRACLKAIDALDEVIRPHPPLSHHRRGRPRRR